MSSRDEALVTPAVMAWARKRAGYDIVVAASKIGRSEEEIKGWEDGSRRPSISQARKAAEVYRRALAVFYLPEPPRDFDVIRDFRRLPLDFDSNLSPALAYVLRQVQNRQEWMHEFLQQQGGKKLSFIGSATLQSSTDKVALSIRSELNITSDHQMACRNRREALNLWIERAEKVGIFICRQGVVGRERISCEEVRGFVLADQIAPFIFINTNDAVAAMMFSLVHEMAHLWINQSGLSNLGSHGKIVNPNFEQVEIYCNEVASLALLPSLLFEQLWSKTDTISDLNQRIQNISEKTKISEEVVARRLLEKGIISQRKYNQLRSYYESRWQDLRKEESSKNRARNIIISPNLLNVLKNGRTFTNSVLFSYNIGYIPGSIASNLLNAKVNNFSKMADYAVGKSNVAVEPL